MVVQSFHVSHHVHIIQGVLDETRKNLSCLEDVVVVNGKVSTVKMFFEVENECPDGLQ